MSASAPAASGDAHVMFSDDDLPFEEELLRNPKSLKAWLRYVGAKETRRGSGRKAPRRQLNMVYERALRELPGSYKLWYGYLKARRKQVRRRCPTDPDFEEVRSC